MPRKKHQKGPWFWRVSIGAMFAVVFGLFTVVAFNQPPTLIAETGCKSDRQDPAHTIVLIDQSDPFSENDIEWVFELINDEAHSLPKYGRLTVLTPNAANPYAPNRVFSKCTPGSGTNANPITQNPKMIEAKWEETFHDPLLADVRIAMLDTRQDNSPLSEAVFAISDRADFQPDAEERRLVVVSDLMQHSSDFSFYKTGADYDAFLQSKLAEAFPRLEGVKVVSRVVPRQMYDLPMGEVKAFWRAYFAETGANYGTLN